MSDTETIDNKQTSSSSFSSSDMNIKGFFTSLICILLLLLFYFSASSAMLFMCKIAQSNILPSDMNCAPYTDSVSTIETKKINIFEVKDKSSKIEFPYELNSKNKLLDMFREYKAKPSSHFLANYFISIAEHILQFNYGSISSVMDSVNSMFSEGGIIGVGPIMLLLLYIVGMITNNVYFIYVWFASMHWFFKTNTNDQQEGLPQWEDVSLFLNPVNWSIGAGLVLLFSLLMILGFGVLMGIPTLLFHNSIISTLSCRGYLNGNTTDSIGLFTVIKEILLHYKIPIVGLFSFFVIVLAFSNLGPILGVCSVITTAFIYHGTMSTNVFTDTYHEMRTPLTDYTQAKKSCQIKSTSKPVGFIKRIFQLLIDTNKRGGAGGDITAQLKQLNKNRMAQ